MITLLDKDSGNRGGSRDAGTALRSTRAKREAEDAGEDITPTFSASSTELDSDKEYRKAVHWLETLRIRRVKILEGGYNVRHMPWYRSTSRTLSVQSLERFVLEGTETVKKVLITYADTMMSVPHVGV